MVCNYRSKLCICRLKVVRRTLTTYLSNSFEVRTIAPLCQCQAGCSQPLGWNRLKRRCSALLPYSLGSKTTRIGSHFSQPTQHRARAEALPLITDRSSSICYKSPIYRSLYHLWSGRLGHQSHSWPDQSDPRNTTHPSYCSA